MTNTTLKPCPFCGCEAWTHETTDGWIVSCSSDQNVLDGFTHMAHAYGGTEAEAIDAWNTRAERTCRDLGGCDEAGMQVFNCSECGCVLSLFDVSGLNTLCTNHIYDYPRYCPICGAKVIGG